MEVIIYIFDMISPVLTGVLFLSYLILHRFKKDRSCFWIGLFFLVHTISRLADNVIKFLPGASENSDIYSEALWLIIRVFLSFIYYKIIVTKSGIEVPGREAAMLVSFGAVIFILAFLPEARAIYFTFLCYILIWGIIRLFPIRKTSKTTEMLLLVITLMFVIQFIDLILMLVFRINVSTICQILFSLVYFVAAIVNFVVQFRSHAPGTGSSEPQPDPVDLLSAEYNLTSRETEIVHLLLSGYTAREIADTAFISEGTAKVHIHNIYQKLGINRRAQINVKIDELLKR